MYKKAMTLLEIIIVLIVMSGIIFFVSASSIFFVDQTQANLERSNIYTEINYAMQDMKIRCVSAVDLNPMFSVKNAANDPDGQDIKTALIFQGEADIYNINPDDTTDKSWYKYYLTNPDASNPPKQDLVLMTCSDSSCSTGKEEVLIDKIFNPNVSFIYEQGSPPNLLTVELTAESNKIPLGANQQVAKEGGIRFWFIDIAQ
ncbi:MAG: hypothetical protein ABSE81_04205 [Candidatus Omnitrophota bacterium]|jgi:type II secretory pathway pseudopilin PulG